MPEPRGLDHSLYPHSSFPPRQAWDLPEGSLAAAVIVYLEEVPGPATPPEGYDSRMRARFVRNGYPTRLQAFYEYGNNVGAFRVLDALKRLDIQATVAVNSRIISSHPQLFERALNDGHEIAAHARDIYDIVPPGAGLEEQAKAIGEATTKISQATGHTPQGWFSQGYSQGKDTLDLLIQNGIRYFCDYGNDDRPYFTQRQEPLLSIPNQAQWDDVEMMAVRQVPAWGYQEAAIRAFDQLMAESQTGSARFFGAHLHPWISGMPHRIGYVERVLEHIAAAESVWLQPVQEIAAQYGTSTAGGAERRFVKQRPTNKE